jgi:mannose-6-phosphate isomerase-like protein (cupin superfamily)
MDERLTVESGLKALQAAGKEFVTLFRHGTLEVELYRPRGVDRQQPHKRDEVYVVVSGSGVFLNGGRRHPFGPGEVLFAPAGVEHRFEDFSDDFVTWVFFYGPDGGEARR